MKKKMQLEIIETGANVASPLANDISLVSNQNIFRQHQPGKLLPKEELGISENAVSAAPPSAVTKRESDRRTSRRGIPHGDVIASDSLAVESITPLIKDKKTIAKEVEKTSEAPSTPATTANHPASTPSTSSTPAKAPCNCGCNKKSKKRKVKKSLFVAAGESKFFDKCTHFDKVENYGAIELAEGASLTAEEIINRGSINSKFDLTLNVERIRAEAGTIESPSKITLASKADLTVRSGDFRAPEVKFDAIGALDVYANRIDGKASVKGGAVSFGVKDGSLNVAEHICTGDPIYWSESTSTLFLPDINILGEDLLIWSNGPNIEVGSINTLAATGLGRVTIVTNAGAVRPGGDPNDPNVPNPYSCSGDCTSFIPAGGGGGTVTINADEQQPSIRANGSIEIRGNVTSGTPSHPGYVWIEAPETISSSSGDNTIKIVGNITTYGQAVILSAGNKIRVDGNISVGDGTASAVSIEAYKGANGSNPSTEFVIGGSGQLNGVNGTISATSTALNGENFILVKNNGTGGIKLDSLSALNVVNGSGKSGKIALNAADGPLTLSAGTLSVDGSGSDAAGRIFIAADALVTTSGTTTLTASDQGSGQQHSIQISVASVECNGTSLTIKSNGGGGVENDLTAAIVSKDLLPLFTTITIVPDGVTPPAIGLHHTMEPVGPSNTSDLTFTGNGTLKVESNSLNAGFRKVACGGSDVTFNGGTVEMDSNGTKSSIQISSYGLLKFEDGEVTLKSNGYDNSKGSLIDVGSYTFEISSNAKLTMHADGDGTGDGGKVGLGVRDASTNPIVLGTSNGSLRATADSGSADGDGGEITISTGSTNGAGTPITITESDDSGNPVLSVSPKGQDGEGGTISIIAKANIDFTEADNELHADGKGNGKGGYIYLTATGANASLSLGENILSAKGGNTGDGGYIQLIANTDLTLKGAKITVEAGQNDNSDGKGGTIASKSENGDITVDGDLHADGKGKGKGGTIFLDAHGEFHLGTSSLVAKGGNKGDGGNIYLKSGEDFTIAGAKTNVEPGQDNDSNGEGGTIRIESGADLTITGTMNANGIGKGKGGNILLRSEEKLTRTNTVLHADGGCLGHGGTISSSGNSIDHANGIATAKAGDGDCLVLRRLANTQGTRGGDYSLVVRGFGPGTLELTDDIDVSGLGLDGTGGTVVIQTPGAFSFGTHDIKADGTTGGGGTIVIEAGADLTVNSSKISALAGTNNGRGGNIRITVKKGAASGILTLAGGFDVTGNGTGEGGNLIFEGQSGVVLRPSEVMLEANGGDDGGRGGSIVINSGETKVDFSDITEKVITAKGGGDAEGGTIEISRARSLRNGVVGIDVRRIMDVDGGPDKPIGKDGSISLNGVRCTQFRTILYPINVWLSDNSMADSTFAPLLVSAASTLPANLRERLQITQLGLYTHDSPARMAQFIDYDITEGESGSTFQIARTADWPVSGLPIYVNIFLHTGKKRQSEIEFNEASYHELGHAIDFALHGPAMLSEEAYDKLAMSGMFSLDFFSSKGTKRASLPRSPCGDSGPFRFIFDNQGKLVCSGGTIKPAYKRWSNSKMAAAFARHIFKKDGDSKGWAELFAQALAFEQYTNGQDPFNTGDSNANWLLRSGLFDCVLSYAAELLEGNLSPRPPCGISIPAWYAKEEDIY